MGGRWIKWERGEAWELDIGAALRGTVVPYHLPPYHGAWGAMVNTSFLGHFKELEDAKRRVEAAIRHDMARVLEDWTRFLQDRSGAPDQLDAAVNEAVAACGGDLRATIRSLLIANSFLEEEEERLKASISNGFARGKHRKRQQQS